MASMGTVKIVFDEDSMKAIADLTAAVERFTLALEASGLTRHLPAGRANCTCQDWPNKVDYRCPVHGLYQSEPWR